MASQSGRSNWCWLLGLALLGSGAARADEAEDKAGAFVQKRNGKVQRDEKAPGKPVVMVNLGFTKVDDAGLKHLAALKNLKELAMVLTKVTFEGAQELQKALLKCLIHC